jgi:alpha-glucosidase
LEHDIIRVTCLPDGVSRLDRTWLITGPDGDTPREGRRRDDLTPFTQPDFTVDAAENRVRLDTDALRLKVFPSDMHLEWATAAGKAFASDLQKQAYAYDRGGRAVRHYMERRGDEHYYGFGEKAGPLDKTGKRLRMQNVDALGYNAETSDPLYKHFPFYITYRADLNLAYGLLYDNFSDSVFDMGQEINAIWGPYRCYEAADGDLDYYLIYGPTIAAVLEKYARLTGYPALPPRWSLGYLGSTMFYTEMPDAQEQLKQFVTLCDEHDIPCDLFHLSSGYTTDPDTAHRMVFTWNRSKIPTPEAMTAHFHEAGIKLSANIKPHLLATHPAYEDVKAAGGFVQAADDDTPEATHCWSGGVYDNAAAAYIDFTSAAGYDWWQRQLTEQLLKVGVDSAWNDNNEFELRDDAARCDGFGDPIPVGMARPLLTLLMGRASYEAIQQYDPGKRPYVISRAGCPGVQRYAQTWSGDNATSWHTLRYNIPMGLGLSLSGLPNTGHDVGGFVGDSPDPELFVRWVQNGIFHPRFTIHSIGVGAQVNTPWMYAETLPLVRDLLNFRYRLIPYLYTLLAESAQTGRPIIRPMVYHFPQDAACHTESFDFMLGPNLLVASVLEPGARTRSVYLPTGVDWCDFHSGAWYTGGQTLELDAPLDRIPLLVPAGGIIPMGRAMRYVGAEPDDVREALIFPARAGGESTFTLIEDDGISTDYRHGGQTHVPLRVLATAETITVLVDEPFGGYDLPYDAVTFILPPGEVRAVEGGAVVTDAQGQRRITVRL